VLPSLTDATEFSTPLFTPVIEGGPLAEADEYRCFLVDPRLAAPTFITASEVLPGAPELVHHVLVMIVDPDAPARGPDGGAITNLERMQALDALSPDRDGWPCFGMAGDGVRTQRRAGDLGSWSRCGRVSEQERRAAFAKRQDRGANPL
jgi:hypothetical protein